MRPRILLLSAVMGCLLVSSASAYTRLYCNELRPGETVTANVGGSIASQEQLSAAMELAGFAAVTSMQVISACVQIATELDVEPAAIRGVSESASLDDRAEKVCKLAAEAVARRNEPIAMPTVVCINNHCPEPQGLPLHFGSILAIRARLAIMAEKASALSSGVQGVTDIKTSCIYYARDRMRASNARIASSQRAVDALIVAAGGT